MSRKRKYPKVSGFWVYSIQIPSINKFYIGVSNQQCCRRWIKSHYKGSSLNQYLDEWQDMIKTVLIDGLTKEESYRYEGKIIDALSMNGLCINEQRSGLVTSDENAYAREYYQNNPEKQEYQKQYYEDNKKKIQERQKQYYQNNTEYRERQNQQRRQRYENDSEYREKILERQRQRRLKKKLEQQLNK